jgi:5-methylcytosine-specific restriction endonuclease McrA
MKRNQYFEQYKDPRWQKKRLEIMQRDEFMCQNCYDRESTLNVHHKYYIYNRKPWEYPNELLITLCKECHESEEESKDIINDMAKVLLSHGYLNHELQTLVELLLRIPARDYGISYILDAVKDYETKQNG